MLAWDVPVSADEACVEDVVWRDLEGVFAVDMVVHGVYSCRDPSRATTCCDGA